MKILQNSDSLGNAGKTIARKITVIAHPYRSSATRFLSFILFEPSYTSKTCDGTSK